MNNWDGGAPIVINFMLACYCGPNPESAVGEVQWNSPSGIQTRDWLKASFLIDESNRATARGRAWIQFICHTPLPVSKWVLPDRETGEAA
jgi:hypothetical protein